MDERWRRAERGGSPLERFRARRKAGSSEGEALEGLLDAQTPYHEVEAVCRARSVLRFVERRTYVCGGRSVEVARFRHARTGITLHLVPGGRFRLGSEDEDPQGRVRERPVVEVEVEPLLVAETVVTQRVWEAWAAHAGVADQRRWRGEELPIEGVNWAEAQAWCEGVGLRLPSEAEWEYACRGGTTTRFCFGDEAGEVGEYGWFAGNAGSAPVPAGLGIDAALETYGCRTQPVGQKRPNAFGLRDVHGNVMEWCEDDFAEDYAGRSGGGEAVRGEPRGVLRVLRGGFCGDAARELRAACRGRFPWHFRWFGAGFRPVLSAGRTR